VTVFVSGEFTGHNGPGGVLCGIAKAGDQILSVSIVAGGTSVGVDQTGSFGKFCPADGVLYQLSVSDFTSFTFLVSLQRG